MLGVLKSATFSFSFSLALALPAGQMDMWHQAYPRPTNQDIRDLASDGTNWVAVGLGGTILVSPDATNWAALAKPLPASPALRAVVFASPRWIAVGSGGTIATSTNAMDWITCPSGTTETFYGVAYGNGRFLTVGSYGAIASSTNGLDWQLESIPNSFKPSLLGLAFGKGIFMTGGLGGVLQTSTDGVTWFQTFSAGHDIHSIAFDGDLFLAGRFNGLIYASPDGTNWLSAGGFSASYPYRFAKHLGNWFCTSGELWKSSDLTNWAYVPTGAFSASSAGGTYAVRALGGTLLIAGAQGNLLGSADGTNFLQYRHGRPLPLACVVRQGNRLVVPTLSADRLVLTSEDGWNWVERPFGATANQAIADGKLFISVGTRGSYDDISVSTSGAAWTPITIRSRSGLFGVTSGSFGYLAVGGGGVVYLSTNGWNWTSNAIAGAPALKSVAAGTSSIVTVGPPGTNYSSTDGLLWMPAPSSTTNQLLTVAFGSGRFVAGGARGTVAWSDDGNVWQNMSLGSSLTIKRVIFADFQFVAATSGATFTSPDGTSWTAETNAPGNLKDIYYASGRFTALSAGTYSTLNVSGKVPLLFTRVERTDDGLIRIETSSGVGEAIALESSADFNIWNTPMLMTNLLGSGAIEANPVGPVGIFRLRSVSP